MDNSTHFDFLKEKIDREKIDRELSHRYRGKYPRGGTEGRQGVMIARARRAATREAFVTAFAILL